MKCHKQDVSHIVTEASLLCMRSVVFAKLREVVIYRAMRVLDGAGCIHVCV